MTSLDKCNTCLGCVEPIVTKTFIDAGGENVIVSLATGCLEVASTRFPASSWNVPMIHSVFGNAAATISGIEAAYHMFKKQKRMDQDVKFLVVAGDGGTYDIGLQSLSGAMERGHDFVYVVLDNGGYMNTGGQRSSSTPYAGITSTTPLGKMQMRKDIIKIASAHNINYVAQASVFDLEDLKQKAIKAFNTKGPALVNVLVPCVRYWRFEIPNMRKLNQLAVDTCFWPIYEIEKGKLKINYIPEKKLPVKDFIDLQGRFKNSTPEQMKSIQTEVDLRWKELLQEAK